MSPGTVNPQERHWTATFDFGAGPNNAPIGDADSELAAYDEAYGALSRLLTGAADGTIEIFHDGQLVRTERLHREGDGPFVAVL